MKNAAVTTRSVRFIVLAELLFTPGMAAMLVTVFDLQWWPATAIFLSFGALRIASYRWVVGRMLGPTEHLQRRAADGRSVSETALRTADNRLQEAPRVITTYSCVGWALSLALTIGLYQLLVGPPGLRSLHLPILVLFVTTAVVGPLGVVLPLISWTVADAAGKNYLLAAEHGFDLERPQRTLASRMGVLSFCMVATPVMLLTAASLAVQSQGAYAAAGQEARALTAELQREASSQDNRAALQALAGRFDAARTTVFLLGSASEPSAVGAPLPSWARPDWLALAVERPFPGSHPGVAVYARRLGDGRIAGALVGMADFSSVFAILLFTVLIVLTAYGLVAGWLSSRSLSLPLERTAELARRAGRQGDLSQIGTLPVSVLDEVGLVTLNLNELLESMRSTAKAAGAVGEGRLAVELDGVGELPDAFRRMLEQLQGVVREMHATSTELAAAAGEIFAASQEQEVAAGSHSAGMIEISQTMGSLSDSAAHVARSVQAVLENAQRTLQNTDQMVARIEALTGHANRIGDILDVIREIADRTDLLALNGSLEATRAGEAGIGFSLVASEMRRLAERVNASVGDIKRLIADIRESGASTVVATEESKKLADSTTQAARSITLVAQQQQNSTEQVNQNVRSVAEVVEQAASATAQTRSSAERLKEQADRLAELVSRFHLA